MNESSKKMPTAIVLFGGAGDLATNMLFPALYDLFAQDVLPSAVNIYVYDFAGQTQKEFRDLLEQKLTEKTRDRIRGTKILNFFLDQIHYVQGSFQDLDNYIRLKEIITEKDHGVCSNKLFYLSASPVFFKDIFTGLKHAKLHDHCDADFGWTRVVVEKPFGHNLASAQELENLLHSTFSHEQVFHVDHYLCKDMVRNMISFRFSNSLFEPLWDNNHIEKISITMHEAKNVATRGAFYDSVGSFRDVGQNHILEMLAFMTMERPENKSPENFQQARANVLELLDLKEDAVFRAQYEEYQSTNGVAKNSETETYFHITAEINNDRWKGVPIELSAGKGLSETRTEMEILFKETPCLCLAGEHNKHQNRLVFTMKPEESINLDLWTKIPGVESSICKKTLSLPYYDPQNPVAIKGAYSKVFYDAIDGVQTLFKSEQEIFAGWKFTDKVLKHLGKKPLAKYALGETPIINNKK